VISLVRAIAPDVESIQLFANSNLSSIFTRSCAAAAAPTPVIMVGTGWNVGLGHAYNEAARIAAERNCDMILLLDQDSRVRPGMPARLASSFDRAGGLANRIVVVGPVPAHPATGMAYKCPRSPRWSSGLPSGLTERFFSISSGSLVNIEGFRIAGPYRGDFFIDGIDIEWCFRARKMGLRCVMVHSEYMAHRLGRGLIRIPLLKMSFVDQAPCRLFTYARNQLLMMRLSHVPIWWKARTIVSLIVRLLFTAALRRESGEVNAILRGIRDGLSGNRTMGHAAGTNELSLRVNRPASTRSDDVHEGCPVRLGAEPDIQTAIAQVRSGVAREGE
jgi:rhamnosyltransferase